MNALSETKFIMKKYNITANKRFGQNFLIDDDVISGIIENAEVSKDDLIIEIGPGLGTLTAELIQNAGKVISIELDINMIRILNDRFSLYDNFELINEDVLKVDLNNLINSNLENSNLKKAKVVDYILEKYKDCTARDLVNITHKKDSPWDKVYDASNFNEIPDELIVRYHKNEIE